MGQKEVIAKENTAIRVHKMGNFSPPPHFLYPANSNLSYFIETNPAPFLSPFSLEGKYAGTCSWI